MVQITEDLIRKRAEHNECIISTLEELSLHQQDIERIEFIDKWCRELKILYLQNNIIPRIENVGRLKKLEYLNLALNNVEIIENLEGCESLRKLDLTVNFIGELTSIETLRGLCHFRELYLTGNPCTDYEGYRDYVIAVLPHLQYLDGKEIEKSERILAVQNLAQNRSGIIEQQRIYRKKRERQKLEEENKERGTKKGGSDWYTNISGEEKEGCTITEIEDTEEDSDDEKKYWEEKVDFTPESRIKIHEHMKEAKQKEENKKNSGGQPPKRERRLQTEDGRILNVNEPRVDFTLTEDEGRQNLVLDIAVYKFLDTSLCDVDVQPTYVKVTMKGKILQLTFSEEVKPDSSTAKRSQTTGHLVITMPKANPPDKVTLRVGSSKNSPPDEKANKETNSSQQQQHLEVDPSVQKCVDIGNIVTDPDQPKVPLLGTTQFAKNVAHERPNSADFVDDEDVPPLV